MPMTTARAMRFSRSASPAERRDPVRRWAQGLWARRREPHLHLQLVLLGLLGVAVWAFALVVEDYLTRDPLVQRDVRLSRWLHEHSSTALSHLFSVVTIAGTIVGLGIVTLFVAWVLVRRGRLNAAVLLCLGAAGIEILNAILKLAFHRPRPELAYVHLDTYSFPSGHAAGSSAIYGLALYLLTREARNLWRIVAGAAYVVLVVAIGFSRLYLEAHYLSDVLAGTALGAAWALVCLIAYEWRHDAAMRLLPSRARVLIERIQ